MARFSVHRLMESDQLIVDLQSNLIDELKTRVVAPLLPVSLFPHSLTRLHVEVEIGAVRYFVATYLLTAVPIHEMGPVIGDLTRYGDEISAAVDFAFQGFRHYHVP